MSTSSTPAADGPTIRRAILGGLVGNFVEWFDFAIYGYSATVIATSFFPNESPTVALLSTFAVYGVAFVFRPLGGIVWGHLGDRRGRRNTLSLVVLLMGIATLAVGLLPTYDSVGLLAPVLLLLCRVLQGFSAGGEFAGSNAFIAEYVAPERRGFWGAVSAASTVLPVLVAAAVVLSLTATLSADSYQAWGWRVPFVLGGLLSVVGLWIRLRMEDTPVFQQIEKQERLAKLPVLVALRRHPRSCATVFSVCALTGVASYMMAGYMVTFLGRTVGLSAKEALVANIAAFSAVLVLGPAFGLLSDRIGRKPLLFLGCVMVIVLAIPGFAIAGAGGLGQAMLGQFLIVLGIAPLYPLFGALQAELFPAEVRYSGAAISYNAAYAIFAGTAPLMSTFLVSHFHSKIAPAVYLTAVAAAVLVVTAGLRIPETSGRSFALAKTAPNQAT